MISIEQFLTSALAESLGWVIMHSLWQASMLAFLYYFVVSIGWPVKAGQQYKLAFGLLCAQLLLSIVTFNWLHQPLETALETVATKEIIPSVNSLADGLATQNTLEQCQAFLLPYLPFITFIWLLGMLLFFARLLMGYVYWYRVKKTAIIAVPMAWQELFKHLKSRMAIRRQVDMGISTMLTSPVLIGHFKPFILLPFALINQLTTEQLEVVLAHELAHFKRFDFILNVIQLLIETIFYYHPAIGWLGRQIRSLREECADDIALAYTGNSMIYARTLLTIAEQDRQQDPMLAIGLLGQHKHDLLIRVQRILQQPIKQPDMRGKFAVISLLLLTAVISLGAAWSFPPDYYDTAPAASFIVDTLPLGQVRVKIDDDGETMNVSLSDGKIERLEINGKEIPSSNFDDYEDKIAEVLKDIPPPPPPPPLAPPAPPSPPGGVAPPSPMVSPSPEFKLRGKTSGLHRKNIDEEQIEIIIERTVDGETKYILHRQRENIAPGSERYVKIAERLAEQKIEIAERQHKIKVRMAEQAEKTTQHLEHIIIRQSSRNNWLEEELLRDGLIDDIENYSVKLTNKRLKVQGKTVSRSLHRKYINLYEQKNRTDFLADTSVNITKKNTSVSITKKNN